MKETETEQTLKKVKRNSKLLWLAFVISLFATIAFWFLMNNSNPEYEEVSAVVLSSEKVEYVNRKTNTRTYKYEVKVKYDGKTYDLHNAHNAYSYVEGKTITAYKANNKLFANVEGVKTATPLANTYYVFLFSSFGLLIIAPSYSAKYRQKKKEEKVNPK